MFKDNISILFRFCNFISLNDEWIWGIRSTLNRPSTRIWIIQATIANSPNFHSEENSNLGQINQRTSEQTEKISIKTIPTRILIWHLSENPPATAEIISKPRQRRINEIDSKSFGFSIWHGGICCVKKFVERNPIPPVRINERSSCDLSIRLSFSLLWKYFRRVRSAQGFASF